MTALLMNRPTPQLSMMLETLLLTPLPKLRARGFNVDRILKKKEAAEAARDAHLKEQRAQEERQRKLITTTQTAQHDNGHNRPSSPRPQADALGGGNGSSQSRRGNHGFPESPKSPAFPMPGAFSDSPDHLPTSGTALAPPTSGATLPPPTQKKKGILSSLTRSLGIDDNSHSANQLQRFLAGNNTPNRPGLGQFSTGNSAYSPTAPTQPRGQGETEAVTDPARVQQNLRSAVSASRAHNSPTLFAPPQTSQVKEVASYCDVKPGKDLRLAGTLSNGIKVYLSIAQTSDVHNDFLQQNQVGVEAFAALLLVVASVFPLPTSTLHIYSDAAGPTIAFNSSGSLFFNFRFFAQLHMAAVLEAGPQTQQARAEALVYWWVTLCHELAHNLVSDHSSDHSFYTEQFVSVYFPKIASMMAVAQNQAAATHAAGPPAYSGLATPFG